MTAITLGNEKFCSSNKSFQELLLTSLFPDPFPVTFWWRTRISAFCTIFQPIAQFFPTKPPTWSGPFGDLLPSKSGSHAVNMRSTVAWTIYELITFLWKVIGRNVLRPGMAGHVGQTPSPTLPPSKSAQSIYSTLTGRTSCPGLVEVRKRLFKLLSLHDQLLYITAPEEEMAFSILERARLLEKMLSLHANEYEDEELSTHIKCSV